MWVPFLWSPEQGGRWAAWGEQGKDAPGGRDVAVGVRGQGTARGELSWHGQLCGLWASEADAAWPEQESRWQVLFSWLIGHLLRGSPHPQDQAAGRSAVSTGGGSAVLLTHIETSPASEAGALGGQRRRAATGCPSGGSGRLPPCPAPHVPLTGAPRLLQTPLAAALLPRGWQVLGLAGGWSPAEERLAGSLDSEGHVGAGRTFCFSSLCLIARPLCFAPRPLGPSGRRANEMGLVSCNSFCTKPSQAHK